MGNKPGWQWFQGAPDRNEGGDERWLITYADMITLLLVLFIILYSMANADVEKFQALAESLRDGFGATSGSTINVGREGGSGGSPIFNEGGASPFEMYPEGQTPVSIFEFADLLVGSGQQAGGQDAGAGADAGQDSAAGADAGDDQGRTGDDQGDRGLGEQDDAGLGAQDDRGLGERDDRGLGDQGDAGSGEAGERDNLGDQGDQGMGDQGDRANMGDQGDQGLGDEGERNLGDQDQGDRSAGDEGDRNLGDEGDAGIGDAGQRQHLGDQGDQGLGNEGERNIGDQGDQGLGDVSDRGLGDRGDAGLGDQSDRGLGDQGTAGLGEDDRAGLGDQGRAGIGDDGRRGIADEGNREGEGAAGDSMEGIPHGVKIEFNERGIKITAFPTELWFQSGSAHLKPTGKEFLDLLIPYLKQLPNRIEIQGHTDSDPISTAVYPSNWELSAGRSGAVIRYLVGQGMQPKKLQAAGYADTLPVDTNKTREGKANNRRVEILILREEAESWDEWRRQR